MTASAKEVMDEACGYPTLDEYLRRDPKVFTGEDWENLILRLRDDRAKWQVEQEKKKAKKQGVEEEEEEND